METMNMCSPHASPPSPGSGNFLPAFLMGQDMQPMSPLSPISQVSPAATVGPKRTSSMNRGPTNLRQKLFNDSTTLESRGPPKQSLFDTVDTLQKSPSNHNASTNFSFNQSISYEHQRESNTLWVTAFGFPPSASSVIFASLSNCGTIIEKKYPSQGNWVHIKYTSVNEVAKALLLNGKLITNCVMIGVVPFHDKNDTMLNKENVDGNFFVSPNRARSLRHSLMAPHTSNALVSPQNLPQKSTGLVTKAMEYMFGW